jgi:hypothetical protein
MLPFTSQSAANIAVLFNTLDEGIGTGTTAASDGTSGSVSSLPAFTNAPSDLVYAIQSVDLMASDTATISNVGLATQSLTWLDGLRTRIDEAVEDLYADTPNNSPYNFGNGVAKSSGVQANARDKILQAIFKYDARYHARYRVNATYGGYNDYYEYPTRHNYFNKPTIIAHTDEHNIGGGTYSTITSLDDNGSGGTYRIETNVPHGLYSWMSIWSTGADNGSAATKRYWLSNVAQSISSTGDGTDTGSKFWFNANIGTNYLVEGNGAMIVANSVGTDWLPLNWQPPRYYKLGDGGYSFNFYRDAAFTDLIIPGYGYVKDIHPGYNNAVDDSSSSATGGVAVTFSNSTGSTQAVHMIYEDTPQAFNAPAGFTGNIGIFERKTVANVNLTTTTWTVGGPGFSIYDGQPINFVLNDTKFLNATNSDDMVYFKKVSSTTFQTYSDASLTTLWTPGTQSNVVNSFTYVSSNARVSYTNTNYATGIDTQTVYFTGTNTDFGNVRTVSTPNSSSPDKLNAAHKFQNGQPVLVKELTGANSNVFVPYYVETAGFAADEVKIYSGISWAGSTPTFSTRLGIANLSGATIQPCFYLDRQSNTSHNLYVNSALTVPFTVSISTTSMTQGSSVAATHNNLISATGTNYIQPMFFCRTEGYYSATLWADSARTTPYSYWLTDGGAGTSGTYTTVQSGAAGTYRINNIGHRYKFGSGATSDTLNGYMSPVYWVLKVNDTKVDLFNESTASIKVTTPAIGSPLTGGTFTATYLDDNVANGRYRLSKIEAFNVGNETYWYDSDGDGVDDSIQAGWHDSGARFYTSHYETNEFLSEPNIITEEYRFANAGAYYGHLRTTQTNVSIANTTTSSIYIDPAVYSSYNNSPVYYALNQPGRIQYKNDIAIHIAAYTDATPIALAADQVALANTAPEWDTVSNMTDVATRVWPSTIYPSSVTWTIEQPNQTFETQNLNRFVRAREQTQYRIRAVYPPMTKAQFKDFNLVIHQARGSFKPFKLYLPTPGDTKLATDTMFARYYDRMANTYLPYQLRFRRSANGGQRLIEIDGAPRNRDQADTSGTGDLYVFGAGHPNAFGDPWNTEAAGYKTQMGGWALPIHNVESNEYGECNIRLNNGVPGVMPVGTKYFRDAALLDVFLDGNNIEIKVDARGFHWLEVEFITKRIF